MSLVSTLVQDSRVTSELSKFEILIEQAGIFDTFKRQSDAPGGILTDELKSTAFVSAGRDVTVPVLNYKDVTVRSTRPLTISADENTSAFVTITWTTLAYGFKMYPAQHFNNEISYQQDFDHKYKAMMRKFIATLEGLGNTALNAAKTQVIGEVTGGHTFASNVVSETGITNLYSSYIMHDLVPMMASNDFYDIGMDVVGNQGLRSIVQRMAGFGQYNNEDKTLPFENKLLHWSNQISNASGKNATGYAVGDGSLGLLTRVEPDAILQTRLGTSHEWDVVELPMIGQVGTYVYEEAVNAASVAGAATAHLTRTGAQNFDFAFDVAFITPYNSDQSTIASPILKFDIDTD
jgi:hypothetical protein